VNPAEERFAGLAHERDAFEIDAKRASVALAKLSPGAGKLVDPRSCEPALEPKSVLKARGFRRDAKHARATSRRLVDDLGDQQ